MRILRGGYLVAVLFLFPKRKFLNLIPHPKGKDVAGDMPPEIAERIRAAALPPKGGPAPCEYSDHRKIFADYQGTSVAASGIFVSVRRNTDAPPTRG